jgi:hypothetical protein
MGVPPKPRGERFLLVGIDFDSGDTLIYFRLCRKQAVEGGDGKFTWVPRMTGADLGITGVSRKWCGKPQQTQHGQRGAVHAAAPVLMKIGFNSQWNSKFPGPTITSTSSIQRPLIIVKHNHSRRQHGDDNDWAYSE